MPETYEELLLVARVAAERAGAVALDSRTRELGCIRKPDGSLVTQADRQAEAAAIEVIAARCPDQAIYGEESGMRGPQGGRFLWTIDPIDGTSAYLRGEDTFAVNVALLENRVAVAGALFHPPSRSMFLATGGRAWLGGRNLPPERPREAGVTLNLQVPNQRHGDRAVVAALAEEGLVTKVIEQGGSPAYALACIAKGAHDHYVFFARRAPSIEDYAGPFLLVRNAGGVVTDLSGREADPLAHAGYLVASGDRARHQAFLAALRAGGFGAQVAAPPCAILVGGLYGTGKSTLALKLAQALGYARFNSDLTRRELGRASYSQADSDVVWGTLFFQAARVLDAGSGVILESTYLDEPRRKPDFDLLRGKGADAVFIEVVCPEALAKARIRARPVSPDGLHVPTNRVEHYDLKKAAWRPVLDSLRRPDRLHVSHLVFDSEKNELREGLVRRRHRPFAEQIAASLATPLLPARGD